MRHESERGSADRDGPVGRVGARRPAPSQPPDQPIGIVLAAMAIALLLGVLAALLLG